jgi:hypothetical protein
MNLPRSDEPLPLDRRHHHQRRRLAWCLINQRAGP